MVPAHIRVEAGLGLGAADFAYQSHSDKGIQNSIHGGPGKAANVAFQLVVKLVGRRMIGALCQAMEQGPPLVGQGKPTGAAAGLKAPELFRRCLLKVAVHVWNYISGGTLCQLVFSGW